MGPDSYPSRPKFHWDVRNPPWTDGKGSQDQYFRAVKLWKNFHDKLPENNSNKIPKSLQGIILQSQLYDRAVDLVKKLTPDEIESEDGALKVALAIHKQDVLSIVTETFHNFLDLLKTKQAESDSFKNFETRFDAQICKLNASCEGAELPSALVSFLLLANSRIDTAQRVSILSSAVPTGSVVSDEDSYPEILSSISYPDIAAVLRACDEPRRPMQTQRYVQGMSAQSTGRVNERHGRQKQKLTPEQLADLKRKSRCNRCKQLGHWATEGSKCPKSPEYSAQKPTGSSSRSGKVDKPVVSSTGTLHFQMADVREFGESDVPGPLVDNAAPYCALGIVELKALSPQILPDWNGKLDVIRKALNDCAFWQYGSGKQASPKRRILGSVLLSAKPDLVTPIQIRHLVLEGSSSWVIGRNVTRVCNIIHIGSNRLEFLDSNGTWEKITMADVGDHSYLDASRFMRNNLSIDGDSSERSLICLTCSVHSAELSWADIKKIIDKVHRHVCGHATYNDIKLLLDRNKIWTDDCAKYLSHIMEQCVNCKVVQLPSGSRKVSLRSMSRSFNDVLCVDHLFIEQHDIIHFMDAQTRYSSGLLVPTTNMRDAIYGMETKWFSEFWPPQSIQGDKAFQAEEFKDYLKIYDISFRLVPPRRHSKNVLESKHRVLRDIYLRMKDNAVNDDPRLLVAKMFRVSNDLYGNSVASSHELAKGYTRPISGNIRREIPLSIIEAQRTLAAKRKLNLILKSKSIQELPIKIGDLVQVYTRLQNQKRGKWSDATPVLAIDPESRTVTVPGSAGRKRDAAIEDVRVAVCDNELATQIQSSIDVLYDDLDDNLSRYSEFNSDDQECPAVVVHTINNDIDPVMSSDYILDTSESIDHDQLTPSSDVDVEDETSQDMIEDEIDLLTHVPAQPSTYDPDPDQGQLHETIDPDASSLAAPPIRSSSSPGEPQERSAASSHPMRLRSQAPMKDAENDQTLNGLVIELLPGTELTSSEQNALLLYQNRFQSKEFLQSHAEGLPSFILENSYNVEENNFLKHCVLTPYNDVPDNANIIRSHVLYKIKVRDDGTLTCKARIAPHGNEDRDKAQLKTDSACCPPLGIRMLFSLCSLFRWYITKIDVKGAFLQSGEASRKVYVVPPQECENKKFVWLLTVATYGLVNANAKWQMHSDQTLINLGLSTLIYVPQLFYKEDKGRLVLVVIKLTDDILVAGYDQEKKRFINDLSSSYDLGTITHLPGICWFFGLEFSQTVDFMIQVHANAKLNKLVPHSIPRIRRKEIDSQLNSIESFHFNSLNGSIGFIGVHALPSAAFTSSYLQQIRNKLTVHDLALQGSMIKKLQRLGSVSTYLSPCSGSHQMSVLVFADAARPNGSGQLGILSGLLIGDFEESSVFHVLSWYSRLSKRPTKSIGSAEVLAAGMAVHEGILISSAFSRLLNANIPVIIAVDSKDVFDSLTSCHVPEDKSIRGDVQLIRHYFETKRIHRVIWIPGSLNIADPLTKKDSNLSDSLQVFLFDGRLPFGFKSAKSRNSEPNLG